MSDTTHLACPYTHCGSSDAFSYKEDTCVGYCHSCGTSYPSNRPTFPWAEKEYPKPEKKVDVKQREVSKSTYEGIRGLDAEVAKIYGIQLQLDSDNKPVRYAFKHPSNVKYRGFDEKVFWTKDRGIPMDDLFGPEFNAGGKRLYLTEGECFTPDTEVLTPSGWKSFGTLEDDDKVMQVDGYGIGTFVNTLGIVDKHYEGDLIRYTSGSYKSLTTENHMLVRINEEGTYTKYPATRYKHLPVPRVMVLTDPTEKLDDTLKYQLWIMLSADFTFREAGDIYGAFNKTQKIERVKHLLDKAGVRYVANVDSRGMTGFFIHRGHNLGWAKEELPWGLITRKDRLALLQELIHWDGNKVRGRNQVEFSSKLKHNADVVQALAHSCGYTSTIMLRTNQFGSWYKVSILYGKGTSTTQNGYTRVPYSGRVMCVTVPSGMILVRHEGSISVSGNCDAASLYQVMGKTYPVKSLPSASISEKFIKKNIDYIKSFQEVVYAGELDDAGRRAAEKLYAAIPEKFYYVPLTKWKDANEFLMNNDGEILKWAALKPQRYSPDNFFCTDEAVEKALLEENPYEYTPTGHSGWDEKARGLVKGGITFIKAPRGTGKTELIRYFETAMLRDETTRIALLHAEEMKSTTYRAMATYHLGLNVRTKDDAKWNNISEQEVISAAKEATKGERTIIFEMRVGDDPMKILEYVRLAATVYGADFIFVDHIQRLAYLSANGVDGATSMLTALGSRMAQLCKELNIGVIFISQVNDDGRTKYAAALEEEAILCILLERDSDSEDEMEKNTTRFIFDKNRPFSKMGDAGAVYYDPDTTLLAEVD
jgi:twinkle protein